MSELTERQQECLRLTATMTDKEIARELGISPHTVNMHIRNAMERLGVSTRGMALRAITRNPLHDIPAMVNEAVESSPEPVGSPIKPADILTTPPLEDSWLVSPARLPTPPKHRLLRVAIILSLAFMLLASAASLVGLFRVVTDSLDDWAVDPKQTLREERQ